MTYQGELLENEPLANYTTWRVGGFAKKLYKPLDAEDLARFIALIPKNEPILWLGLGSNSLIRDEGFEGTVILTQGCLKGISLLEPGKVRVEAGVSCATMARFCARNGLAEAEFWAGIPGTMGGALRMNAGCFNGETWNFVTQVETMNRAGEIHLRDKTEFDISYRHVAGLKAEWFLSAICAFSPGDKESSLQTIKALLARRAETQPTNEYNCGSVFRNPKPHFAARLIESCGLKGYKIGEAQVSEKHANFIINYQGKAKAKDIESLIEHVREMVYKETAIRLEREVHIIGGNQCLIASI